MSVSAQLVKELRDITSAGFNDCKTALEESKGDVKKAVDLLRKKGLEIAAKKKERLAKDGRIESYIHAGGKIGALVEVDCETDFVAKNEEFCQFTKDLAMQIAAQNPKYLKKEDVPKELVEKFDDKEKDKFFKDNCLLEQAFIKDAAISINDCLNSIIAKVGENIVIRRYSRFKIGE